MSNVMIVQARPLTRGEIAAKETLEAQKPAARAARFREQIKDCDTYIANETECLKQHQGTTQGEMIERGLKRVRGEKMLAETWLKEAEKEAEEKAAAAGIRQRNAPPEPLALPKPALPEVLGNESWRHALDNWEKPTVTAEHLAPISPWDAPGSSHHVFEMNKGIFLPLNCGDKARERITRLRFEVRACYELFGRREFSMRVRKASQ